MRLTRIIYKDAACTAHSMHSVSVVKKLPGNAVKGNNHCSEYHTSHVSELSGQDAKSWWYVM
jgi:hypothetical protein